VPPRSLLLFRLRRRGDVVRFVERAENLSFTEAVEQLAQRYAITLEYEDGGRTRRGTQGADDRLLQLLDKRLVSTSAICGDGERTVARDYLSGRV
jgi:DNA primase